MSAAEFAALRPGVFLPDMPLLVANRTRES
jgi:hypothetical protein